MCIYVYIYRYISICLEIYIYMCIFLHMYQAHLYAHIYTYILIYTYLYICMYTYVYIFIHMYTHIYKYQPQNDDMTKWFKSHLFFLLLFCSGQVSEKLGLQLFLSISRKRRLHRHVFFSLFRCAVNIFPQFSRNCGNDLISSSKN